jgi:hypothetical protein
MLLLLLSRKKYFIGATGIFLTNENIRFYIRKRCDKFVRGGVSMGS